jgi:lysophospholipase L1-like esterase
MPEKRSPLKVAFCGDSLTEGFPGSAYFEVLKKKYPLHHLYNYGKGGDTVKSLLKRLAKMDLDFPFDIIFLWIGVNDILVDVSPLYPYIKRLRRQPWAKNPDEFLQNYQLLLELLIPKTELLFTVSPLFIGEDLANPWNRKLEQLSEKIRSLSQGYSSVDFISLRDSFSPLLRDKSVVPYRPKNAARIIKDILSLKHIEQKEDRSQIQGQHFTLDGIHLNQKGAKIVAERFSQKIKTQTETTPPV